MPNAEATRRVDAAPRRATSKTCARAATTRGRRVADREIGENATRAVNRARAKGARSNGGHRGARSRTTRRRRTHPQQEVSSSTVSTNGDGSLEADAVGAGSGAAMRSDAASARSLARARAAHRSRERARERRAGASAAGSVDSAFVVVVVVVVVVDRSVGSSVVRGDGVSGNESARGVAGARASAVAGANSKLASASASSVGVAAGARRSFSLTALSSFGTNRSLIVSRSIADVLASLARVEGVAPSPRRRTDACALTRRASTRAAYASYASNAADPFFATYA